MLRRVHSTRIYYVVYKCHYHRLRLAWGTSFLFAAMLECAPCRAESGAPQPQLSPAATSFAASQDRSDLRLQNQPERLEWLRDAGFGLFVHWSVDSQVGSVISHSLVGASDDYTNWYYQRAAQDLQSTTLESRRTG